jgi:tRNA pseudouridine38-40 synthase
MRTFKLILAYDGTDYVGWQRQAAGVSIQSLLEDALRELDGRDVAVAGAGRTDAGVHALAQVASCALERTIAAGTLVRALNHKLPPDVRVRHAMEMPAGFHARFDARGKIYRYRLWNHSVFSPFQHRFAWHLPGALDLDAMREAARLVEGTHDFAAFQGQKSDAQTTVRTVNRFRILDRGGPGRSGPDEGASACRIDCEISGNGFLRHMVRTLVGTLVEIGRGRREPDWMSHVIASRDRRLGGQTAPARGLFLVSVAYAADACG